MDQQSIQRLRRILGETNLLVVDDTPIIRGIVESILEPLGMRAIFQACNGEEAWSILEANRVGLVVADWLMPGIDGMELLKKMRSDERFAPIPFIMITGMPNKQVVVDAMKNGVTDFLTKPIDGSVLKQKILKALSKAADAA